MTTGKIFVRPDEEFEVGSAEIPANRSLGVGTAAFECHTGMIADPDTIIEGDGHTLLKMHLATEQLADLPKDGLIVQTEMATRLAAAEW